MIGFTSKLHEEIERLNFEIKKRDAKILRLEIENKKLRVVHHWREEQEKQCITHHGVQRPWGVVSDPIIQPLHSYTDSSSKSSCNSNPSYDSSSSCCSSSNCD